MNECEGSKAPRRWKAGIGHGFLAPGLEREKSTGQIITDVCACAFVYVCVCVCVNLSCCKCHEGKFRDAMTTREWQKAE